MTYISRGKQKQRRQNFIVQNLPRIPSILSGSSFISIHVSMSSLIVFMYVDLALYLFFLIDLESPNLSYTWTKFDPRYNSNWDYIVSYYRTRAKYTITPINFSVVSPHFLDRISVAVKTKYISSLKTAL